MTNLDVQTTRESFDIIRELAALCATPGIESDTQEKANKLIQNLLDSSIKNSVQFLNAKSSGIVTKL